VKALESALVAVILAGAGLSVFAGTAAAEGPAPAAAAAAPVSLVLELDPSSPVDGERLRAAIAGELGVPVVWARGGKSGVIVVRQEGARVVVSFDGPGGRHDGRSIPLPAEAEQAERDISLLAGNVARDQVAPFLPVPVEAPPPPAPVTAAHFSPCTAPGPIFPVGLDVAPFVGVSSFDRGRSIWLGAIGMAGVVTGGIRGFGVAGAVDVAAGPLCGLQLAGAVNVAGPTSGAQLSGAVNVAAGDVAGAQVGGAANVAAGEVTGLQVAPINVASGPVHGVQIGVINYAKDADFQLGLVNINASGRVLMDIWSEAEMGMGWIAIKHGGKHYHWIYALGARAADLSRPWFAVGAGWNSTHFDKLHADVDLLMENQFVFNDVTQVSVAQARVFLGYPLIPGLTVVGGPTFNFLMEGKSARSGAPGYASDVADTSTRNYRGWVGVSLGIEAP
jgi:hypothetical protein